MCVHASTGAAVIFKILLLLDSLILVILVTMRYLNTVKQYIIRQIAPEDTTLWNYPPLLYASRPISFVHRPS